MTLTYDIGGVPTKTNVSNMLINMAHFLQSTHQQAETYWRTLAQTLATDQQKTDAGLDIATFPFDKTMIDTMSSIMLQLKTLLEGGVPAQVTDTRDFCVQVTGPQG